MRLIDASKLKCDVLKLFDMHPELFNFKSRVKILCIIDSQPTQNVDSNKVLYVCDKRYCEKCNNPDCHYTMDISHAANFEKNECGDYQEKIQTMPKLTINRY